MSVRISTTNSKLGLIPSVNLPPIITCRKNCPCSSFCYATKGRYLYENVKRTLLNNFNEYQFDHDKYFDAIRTAIDNGVICYKYFRWHASGDIISIDYLRGMVAVANALPTTEFLAFTKQFEIVNAFVECEGNLPRNLHIVFSAWGDDFIVDNPYNFPVAYVRFKDMTQNKTIPKNAIECNGDCTHCLRCWEIKHGEAVVFNKH